MRSANEAQGARQYASKLLVLGLFVLPIVLTVAVLASPWFRQIRATQIERNERLLQAVESGDIDQVRRVLTGGAVVNARTRAGLTALSVAILRGYEDIALLLIEKGASLDARDRSGDRENSTQATRPCITRRYTAGRACWRRCSIVGCRRTCATATGARC